MMFDLPVLEGWRLVKLSDLGEVNRGRSRHRPRDATHLYGGIYPFVQTGDIKASGGRVVKYSQTYSEDGLAQSRLWPKGTMCITIAANIAETGILQFPACFPDSVIGFIADEHKCNVYFIEYVFRLLRRQIQAQATGSVQDNINLQTLERLLFPIPEIEEQKRIAEVLCSFDNKIELNRQTNQTLEHIAQAIFKSWFVDFEPTRAKIKAKKHWQAAQQNIKASSPNDYAEPSDKQHQHTTSLQEAMNRAAMAAISGKTEAELNNLPADTLQQLRTTAELFPDTLVESELGEIPAGWEVGQLSEIIEQRVERVKSSEETKAVPYVPIDCISANSLFLSEYKSGEEAKSSLTRIYKGDIIFGAMRPYFHKVCIAPFYATTRTTAFVLKPYIQSDFSFCVLRMHQKETIDYATLHSTGSTIPYAKWEGSLADMLIVLPRTKLREQFNLLVEPTLRSISQKIFEYENLKTLRDTLLPKLLSGELSLDTNHAKNGEVI